MFDEILAQIPARMIPISREIVAREGGYVDHPNDPGGATKHGVSIRYARECGTLFDLDKDGDVDKDDIRLITPEMAVAVFLVEFYLEPKINTLPVVLQASIMDMAVNAGPRTAIRLAQRMFNNLRVNDWDRLTEDGAIGPKTRQALEMAATRYGNRLLQLYANERVAHYRSLAANNPRLAVFLRGWENRARDAAKV